MPETRRSLPLAETGADTGVFEGSIQPVLQLLRQSGQQPAGDGQQPGSGVPRRAGDGELRSVQRHGAHGGARVVFIDGFGRETTTFPIGSRVRVRVTDPYARQPDEPGHHVRDAVRLPERPGVVPAHRDGLQHAASSRARSRAGRRARLVNDGTLQGTESCLIRASTTTPTPRPRRRPTATFTGGEVLFVDAQGQPASVFLEGTRAYLRVVDPGRSGTVQVDVTAELSGDQEQVVLSETGPGVFTGSIELRSVSVRIRSRTAFWRRRRLPVRRTSSRRCGRSTRTRRETPRPRPRRSNFRVWFIDAYGSVTTTLRPGLAGVRAAGEPQLQRSGAVRPAGRDGAHEPWRRGAVAAPGDGQDHGHL